MAALVMATWIAEMGIEPTQTLYLFLRLDSYASLSVCPSVCHYAKSHWIIIRQKKLLENIWSKVMWVKVK